MTKKKNEATKQEKVYFYWVSPRGFANEGVYFRVEEQYKEQFLRDFDNYEYDPNFKVFETSEQAAREELRNLDSYDVCHIFNDIINYTSDYFGLSLAEMAEKHVEQNPGKFI